MFGELAHVDADFLDYPEVFNACDKEWRIDELTTKNELRQSL